MSSTPEWPSLKRYDAAHLARVAMPIGGIGTGTVSIGGRGDLRDWEIVQRPAKGFAPKHTFFAVHAGSSFTWLLEGPIPYDEFEGSSGSETKNHGMPRFRNCEFEAAYPFGQVLLSDDASPVDARIQAFNPLIPTDPDNSGIPMAAFRIVLTNKTDQPIETAVCASLENFIGRDGKLGES